MTLQPRLHVCALASFALSLAASSPSIASENFDLRYAPGNGGGDMSAPLDPGTYFQVPFFAYHGTYMLISIQK